MLTAPIAALLVASTVAVYEPAQPAKVTAHPAEEYSPVVSPDGRLMAFVSDQAGPPNIWIKTVTGTEIPTPRRLTTSAAGDKSPAFAPDGKSVVYVSYGSDSDGDLYLLVLPRTRDIAAGTRPTPERLTDFSTADKDPVFAPGGRVIFTSADKKDGKEDLWSLDPKTKERQKITPGGGSQPAVSPRGDSVVYVIRRPDGNGSLARINLMTKQVTQLTHGEYSDLFPAFLDERRIVFVRYADDTNRDGAINLDDNPSLWVMDVQTPEKPPFPITGGEGYDLFPSSAGDLIYFSSKRKDAVDIYRLSKDAASPPLSTEPAANLQWAKSVKAVYPGRPMLELMALRMAYSAGYPSADSNTLAETLYGAAKEISENQSPKTAVKVYGQILSAHPDAKPWAGLAEVDKAAATGGEPRLMIEKLAILEKKHKKIPEAVAKARIETATALASDGAAGEAVKILRKVTEDFSSMRDLAAEASYRVNRIYEMTADKAKAREALLDVIISFPDSPEWSSRAIDRLLDLAVVKNDPRASTSNLYDLAEKQSAIPKLAARAMNRAASIFMEDNELAKARDAYGLTVSRFPGETEEKNQALLKMAEIYAEQEEFARAIEIYGLIGRDSAARREAVAKSREGHIRQSARKGEKELANGEPRIALKTFLALADREPSAVEAHRGIIRSRVAVNETEKAARDYEALLKSDPANDVYAYSLGLALTYVDKPPFARSESLIKSAIAANEKDPWRHQTLGWIHEQREALARDGLNAEMAMQEYAYAYALTDADAYPDRAADLLLNMGNVNYALNNCADALENYHARERLSSSAARGGVAESVYQQRKAECEFRLGDDEKAVASFRRAISLAATEDGPRRVELYERMGLAHQSAGKWREAAEDFTESLRLRRSLGIREGEVPVLRNIANNLYMLGQSSEGGGKETLEEALRFYRESESALSKPAEPKKPAEKKSGGSLFTVEIEAGPHGALGLSRGFTETDEKKLIYHHIGKIYGELGDHRAAVEYFEKKLALTPMVLPLAGNVPALTEKSIILNQLAYYLARLGNMEEAAKRLYESLDLCLKIESVNGIVVNADSLARLALSRQISFHDEIMLRGGAALDFALEKKADDLLAGMALNHFARLHHERFARSMAEPVAGDPRAAFKAFEDAARDLSTAERRYKTALALLGKRLGEPGAASAYFDTVLGLADISRLAGKEAEAKSTLDEAEPLAVSIMDNNALWKIRFHKYLMGGGRDLKNLEEAVLIFEGLPFGTDISDDYRGTLALVRLMYAEAATARSAKSDVAALESLEKGLVGTARLGLYGLMKNGADAGLVPGMKEPVSLLEEREKMIEGFAEEFAAGAKDEASHASRKARYGEWAGEYKKALEKLRAENPVLWAVAAQGELDISAVMDSLDGDEAAVYLWRTVSGAKLYVVRRQGISVAPAGNDETGGMGAPFDDPAFKDANRVYHVTERPLTDPFTAAIAKKFSVSSIPSFSSIPIFKGARNISDGSLLVAGSAPDLLKETAPVFAESRMLTGEAAGKYLSKDGGAGIAVFAGKPRIPYGETLALEMDVDGATVSMPQLAGAGAQRALLVTKPADAGSDMEWEQGAALSALVAGFPSWAVLYADGADYTKTAAGLLKAFAGKPLDEALRAATAPGKPSGAARMVGSFGFNAEERREYAKAKFAEKVRAAADLVKKEDWEKASLALRQSLAYTSAAGVSKYDETLLSRLSEADFRRGDFESSLSSRERLNSVHRAREDKLKLADSLLLTGVIQTRLGRHEAAVAAMSEAVDIYREKGVLNKIAAASSQLGLAEEGFANYGRALEAYGTALSMQQQTGDEVNAARELRRMGRIYHLRLNQFGKAREAYKEALSVFRQNGDMRGALMTLIDIGSVEMDAGALPKAEEIFNSAMEEAKAQSDDSSEAIVEFHLANLRWFRGEYEPALRSARKAVKIAESLGNDGQSAIILNTIGLVYWTLNDYQKAMDNLERSLAMAKKAGLRLDEASAHNNAGLVLRSMGRIDESIDRFKTALSIDREIKSDWAVAYDLRNLSISLLMKGDIAGSETAAKGSLALTEKIGDRVNAAKARLQLAETLAAKGETAAAMEEFKHASDQAVAAGTPETLWRALRGIGRMRKIQNDRPGAIESYKKAVDVVESMRAAIKANELKGGFLDDKQDLYEELILLMLDAKEVDGAFAYAERARSRSFMDLLGALAIEPVDEASKSAYERVQALKNRREELVRAGATDNGKLPAELEKVEADLILAVEQLRDTAPELAQFVMVEPTDSKRALAALGSEAVLFEYVVTAREVVIFSLGGGDIEAVRIPFERNELEKLVLEYRRLIQEGAPLGDRPRAIAALLIEPVKKWLKNGEALAIAPHGVLHYLSFAPLPVDDQTLLEKKPIFYIPSMSVFERTKSRRVAADPATLRALAVGDPDTGGLSMSLPLSELEARSLKWVFPDSEILTGAAATEKKVVADAASFQIVHIASHGQFDPSDPLMSGLYLAPGNGNDGVLRAKEVFSMTISADLVALSACQTGLGKVTKGDEIIGLNRAFLYSGAHALLSTLWRVDDMASASLVKHFYRGLESGSKAEALRKAQLTVKRRFPHPAFWAGFTLVGDYR